MHAGNIHKGYNKSRVHFYFWSRCCCCCYVRLRAADAAHNICTQATRGITFSFSVVALLLLFTHREGCAEKNKIGFCFLFDTGTQSIAFSVVMVVDCAAVETGCMLEKYIKVPTKYVFIFIFWSRCCCVLLLLRAAAAVHNISAETERGTGYCFFLLSFCPLQCDASDVYCCCCFWLLLFLSF